MFRPKSSTQTGKQIALTDRLHQELSNVNTPKSIVGFFNYFLDSITSAAHQNMSEVSGAKQYLVVDVKYWVPNDITDGTKLIRNWPERFKKKENFKPKRVSKDFNLKRLGTHLSQLFDVDDSGDYQLKALLPFFSFWRVTKGIAIHVNPSVYEFFYHVHDSIIYPRRTGERHQEHNGSGSKNLQRKKCTQQWIWEDLHMNNEQKEKSCIRCVLQLLGIH